MKKISLEIQAACGIKTGIGWYIYNLVKNLKENNNNEYTGEVFNFMSRKNLEDFSKINLNIKQNKVIPYPIYDKIKRKLPIKYNRLIGTKSDIYHFFNFIIPKNIDGKVILTIYDTVFITAKETINFKRPIDDYINSAKQADKIITVSESAKSDIIKNLGVEANKIDVIYPGIDLEIYNKNYTDEEKKKVKEKYFLPENYLLFLGTIEPRKNLVNVLKAFAKFKAKDKKMKLVVSGKLGWKSENIPELIERLGIKDNIIFTGYVDEIDKVLIYKLAKIFLFPSIYEGFGMPILEAMAAGIPVITSNCSSMPEVVGESGILINPNSYDEICNAIEDITNEDRKSLQKRITLGIERSKKFTWNESSKKLELLYEKVYKL